MRTLLATLFLVIVTSVAAFGSLTAETAPQADDQGELTIETNKNLGAVTGFAIPRYVSLKSDEINLRNGPGRRYPIAWVMQRADLPVVVIDEHEHWRQVRTHDGVVGWVHKSLISGKRTFRVMSGKLSLRRRPTQDGFVVALLAEGMVGELNRCRAHWCRATVYDEAGQRYRGWIARTKDGLFGINPGEEI